MGEVLNLSAFFIFWLSCIERGYWLEAEGLSVRGSGRKKVLTSGLERGKVNGQKKCNLISEKYSEHLLLCDIEMEPRGHGF